MCSRLRSQAKLAVYFKDMERVNFKLFPKEAFNKLVVFNFKCKKIGFAVSKQKNFSQSIQSAITHSQSFRGYHNASLLLSPQVSLTVAPFLGAPRRWSVSSSTRWGRTWLGTGPGAFRDPVAIPGELVCLSKEPGWGLFGKWERWSEREPGMPSGGTPPPPSWGSFTRAWLRHQAQGNRTGASRNVAETKHHARRIWRTQVYHAGGPKGVDALSFEPQTKGLQFLYTDRHD